MSRPASKGKAAQSTVSEPARTRPSFTITEAQQATGASRSTLRRRLAEQAFPNAYRAGKTQEWRIPVDDLLAAGLRVNAPAPPESVLTEQTRSERDQQADRVTELEKLLAVERARREAAEQLAQERADRVEDLRTALRMLEAGPVGRAQQADQGEQGQERRGWFGRRPK